MGRTGRTWSHLMVDVAPSNAKLRGRLLRLLVQATGFDEADCEKALAETDNEAKAALVVLQTGVTPNRARAALAAAGGIVAAALCGRREHADELSRPCPLSAGAIGAGNAPSRECGQARRASPGTAAEQRRRTGSR